MLMWGPNLCQSPPQLPKASGTPVWPILGVSAGAVLARRDTAVTRGPGAPQPRQLLSAPRRLLLGHGCVPAPGRAGGAALHHRGRPLSPEPLFSPFFFPTQWKTIFERLHHAGVSGAAGGERG